MSELERLEAWLIKRAAIHAANSEACRINESKHSLLVSNAKRNECLAVLEAVRFISEAFEK